MSQDTMPQVARYWDAQATKFDAIYTGKKSAFQRALDRTLRSDIYERFDWVMQEAGDVRNQRVCDIGCGSGRFVNALAKRGASHVTGIDVAPSMLRLARELVDSDGVGERCRFEVGDILTWAGEDTFDLTIAIGFWDYIADPLSRLRVIRRITGGTFLSAWPRLWTWRMPIRKARLSALGCPVYFFRESQVRGLLAAAGFRIDGFHTVGKLFCVRAHAV